MKTTKIKLTVGLAACFLVAQFCSARATTIIDLDLSHDTAANSGTAGNGSVGVYDNGASAWVSATGTWENRNATGNPAGRAYNTGANGSGPAATNAPNGTIYWGTPAINALKGKSTFSLYVWVKPETLMNGGRILNYNNSELQLLVQQGTGGVMQMQLTTKISGGSTESQRVNFGSTATSVLGSSALDQWVFLGLSFDSGAVTMFAGQAVSIDLVSGSLAFAKTSLDATATNGLVMLNDAQSTANNRPFDGSLGGFYLSDEAMNPAGFESIFDAQKTQFIAVPETSSFHAALFGLCGLGLLMYGGKLKTCR